MNVTDKISTIIDACIVTIEPNEDREGVNCYIQNGRYSASLACAMDTGELDSGSGTIGISQYTLNRIEAFAEKHGY